MAKSRLFVLLSTWNRLYKEPAIYAPDFTRWSRNFLNLGIGALLVSWFFQVWPAQVRFAFADNSTIQIEQMAKVEGEWLYIGGRNSMHAGIVEPGTRRFLAHMNLSLPARTGPHSLNKPASGYVLPDLGIVQLQVDGNTVLTVMEAQEHYRQSTYRFLFVITFSVVMLLLSVSRQWLLTNEREESPSDAQPSNPPDAAR